jgi:hypothetical protein
MSGVNLTLNMAQRHNMVMSLGAMWELWQPLIVEAK